MAQTYHGVVKDSVVVIPEGMDLPEGTRVEVRVLAPREVERSESRIPDAVKEELLARGLVLQFKEQVPAAWFDDYTPIRVAGKPLSEIIIEERR